MNADIDMDLDFEADADPELARMQAEAAKLNALPSMATESEAENEQMNGVEEGEVAPSDIAATKVHIEGLAELNTQDIENFARDHYESDLFRRVEWVNDHSANLVYDTAQAAGEALQILSNVEVEDPLELRPAKALSTHPHVDLYVRQAKVTDEKIKGAAQYSRYYLLHPEADPESRISRGGGGRGRGRGRGRGGYGRRERSDSQRSSNAEPFDVNLYDDDPASVAARVPPAAPRRRVSHYSEEDLFANRSRGSRRPRREEEDLFAGRPDGRLRNRSASPVREGDGRFGFNEDQPRRETARRRSRTPPRRRSVGENYRARETMKQELFPAKKNASALSNGNGHSYSKSSVELFPTRTLSTSKDRELFPEKVQHKREDTISMHPDEVATAIGKFDLNRQKDFSTHDGPDRRLDNAKPRGKPRDLFERIGTTTTIGRLNPEPLPPAASGGGFSIKGAGARNDSEISFLGASKDRPTELFPKGGGAGRDLFQDKMRNSRRRGAEHFI